MSEESLRRCQTPQIYFKLYDVAIQERCWLKNDKMADLLEEAAETIKFLSDRLIERTRDLTK